MKAILAILLSGLVTALAEGPHIELTPNQQRDFARELIEKFETVLESDASLKAQFEQYQSEAKETAGGRWNGPTASALVLHRSYNVQTDPNGSRDDYAQTLVIYYSFPIGYRRGMTADSGVFAVFRITGGELSAPDGRVLQEEVSADFRGFQKTLAADAEPGE